MKKKLTQICIWHQPARNHLADVIRKKLDYLDSGYTKKGCVFCDGRNTGCETYHAREVTRRYRR